MTTDKNKKERIYQTIRCVPIGKIASYGQIADLAGLPGRARLVGKILRDSPPEIKLPWHRIMRSNGQLAFDKGSDKAIEQKGLLQEEGVVVLNNRVKLERFGWRPGLGELLGMKF